eukprot:scaffold70137_cov19-Tisochrysis_lutea.AAC.1
MPELSIVGRVVWGWQGFRSCPGNKGVYFAYGHMPFVAIVLVPLRSNPSLYTACGVPYRTRFDTSVFSCRALPFVSGNYSPRPLQGFCACD